MESFRLRIKNYDNFVQFCRLELRVSQLDELHKEKESKPLAHFGDDSGSHAGDKRNVRNRFNYDA